MFTGIVQGTAKIVLITKKLNFYTYTIEFPLHMLKKLKEGDSISNNGCCLTVVKIQENYISFDLIKETLQITNLGSLKVGDFINVERAAKFNEEIGGHPMSGHIITTAEIVKIISSFNERDIWLKMKDSNVMKYVFYKGFIGVEGISLTTGKITSDLFCVHLIPETIRRTTIGTKKIGQQVNIEIDSKTQTIVDSVERILSKGIKL